MAFDPVRLLGRVEIAIMKDFVNAHGERDAAERIEWQQESRPLASDIVSALREKNWALGALENWHLSQKVGAAPSCDQQDTTDPSLWTVLIIQSGPMKRAQSGLQPKTKHFLTISCLQRMP